MKRTAIGMFAAAGLATLSPLAVGQTTVGIDGSAAWESFMEVFELGSDGSGEVRDGETAGAFVFGSGWGVADAVAIVDEGADTVTLSPNVINDPNEFWYQNTTGTAADPTNPGGPGQLGNKFMQANTFVADDSLVGQTITFEGTVLSDTTLDNHKTKIWIRDFVPDYSSFETTEIDLAVGDFSITLDTIDEPGRHIQYGFTMRGENVWSTDVAPFGSVVIGALSTDTSLVGDYNGDGFVSQSDLDLVLLNWGDASAPAGYDETAVDGGGPFDGLMSQNELDSVLLNWGSGTAPNLSAVPEPASLVLLGLGGLALAGRRRAH